MATNCNKQSNIMHHPSQKVISMYTVKRDAGDSVPHVSVAAWVTQSLMRPRAIGSFAGRRAPSDSILGFSVYSLLRIPCVAFDSISSG